jgi:type VI secretion system lysozyme-like protein
MESRHKLDLVEQRMGPGAGLSTPLFDRFDEELDDSRVAEPYRMQNFSLLVESIGREINRLLNTRVAPRRAPDSPWEPRSRPMTVIDYGLPAFSALEAGSPADAALLSAAIAERIANFEPRLRNPSVELHPVPDNPSAMVGVLRGTLQLENMTHPVRFEVYCDHQGESARVVAADSEARS